MNYRWENGHCWDEGGKLVGSIWSFANNRKWTDGKDIWDSESAAVAGVEKKAYWGQQTIVDQPRKGFMLSEIGTDIKGFIRENRNVIFWLALAFLIDHLFFHGAFRERLNSAVNKLIGKVEKQIEAQP